MTEGLIINRLRGMNYNNSQYIIENIFVFDSEMDLFVQKPNGYIVEYEVKCSIEDFKKDFKKVKHNWMTQRHHHKIPNKFYFVCPDGLIPLETVPEYAGLIYIGKGETIVKQAPFLHKHKLEVEKSLFQKVYWRWVNEKKKNLKKQW